MTYRERREARAERLRGWADKRTAEATGTLDAIDRQYGGDHAFNTQPGHIPERARVIAREERAFESLDKAEGMASRAAGIESQLDRAIYDDDPDAVGALRERIAGLEAERERYKAVNALIRRQMRGVTSLDDKARNLAAMAADGAITAGELAELLGTMRAFAGVYAGSKALPTYGYQLTNLSGNIARQRQRLARLEREGPDPDRAILARFGSTCAECGGPIAKGAAILYSEARGARHAEHAAVTA